MTKGDVIVLGAGLMGSSIAMDLLESSAVSKVAVVDSSSDRLRADAGESFQAFRTGPYHGEQPEAERRSSRPWRWTS